MTSQPQLLPDAMLVERIAALGDKSALGELDARYGLTLYAIAYTGLLDADAADAAVAAALRELWLEAASFDPRLGNARAWLGALTRGAVRQRLHAIRQQQRSAPVRRLVQPAPRQQGRGRRVVGLVRAAVARVARFAAALALPTLLPR